MRKIIVYLNLLSFVCLIESALSAPDVAIVEDKALAHTAQILPVDAEGKIVGEHIDEQYEFIQRQAQYLVLLGQKYLRELV